MTGPPQSGRINLQATLATASATTPAMVVGGEDLMVRPHHPITCSSDLRLEENGSLGCEHALAPPGDFRTQSCLDHSIALLLIEFGAAL